MNSILLIVLSSMFQIAYILEDVANSLIRRSPLPSDHPMHAMQLLSRRVRAGPNSAAGSNINYCMHSTSPMWRRISMLVIIL